MAGHERVCFPSRGTPPVELEGNFHPAAERGLRPAAVVCHPHSLFGGSMYNNVVLAIAQALPERGIAALRFNFRGVMGSGGEYDQGRAEQDDVAGAVDWLLGRPDVDPARVFTVGYSFGAWVSLAEAVGDARIAAAATVSLVPWRFDVGLDEPADRRAQFAAGYLQSFTRPKLFVVGQRDTIALPDELRTLVDRVPPPKDLRILPGTDHYFQGREAEVGDVIAQWLAHL